MGIPYVDPSTIYSAVGYAGAAYSAYKKLSSGQAMEPTGAFDQGTGLRRYVTRKVVGGRKKYQLRKLINSTVNVTEQCLGIREVSTEDLLNKHLVSEYNIGRGGFISIAQNSEKDATPMHIYDLNHYVGTAPDTVGNWPVTAVNGTNTDINSRAWYWKQNHWNPLRYHSGTALNLEPRWYINEPRTEAQQSHNSTKVYRKGIAIDYMLYGTTAMPTEFDVRVIKITDPRMCPDYRPVQDGADLDTFRQNWQNLVRAWCINPMLRGIEPGPSPVKPWFRTIAKKRVSVGEKTSDIESVASVQGRMYVHINEAQRYAWDDKDFDHEADDAAYDNVPKVDDEGSNDNFKHKPYYTSRYYLLIRALSPMDQKVSGQDGAVSGDQYENQFQDVGITYNYCTPSYDVAVRTTFLTINGV